MSLFDNNFLSIFVLVTLNLLTYTNNVVTSFANPHLMHHECPKKDFSYNLGDAFEGNLTHALLTVLPEASVSGFANFTAGEGGIDQVHALSYCRGDINGRDCVNCVLAAAKTALQRCPLHKEGLVWYEECTLRYANRTIFSLEEEIPSYRYYNFSSVLTSLEQDEERFDGLMESLINYGGDRDDDETMPHYATGEVGLSMTTTPRLVLHGVVQCSPDIDARAACERCLRAALKQRDGWSTTMIFLPSCSLRFDLLYLDSFSPPRPPPPPATWSLILGVSLGIGGPILIVLLLLILAYRGVIPPILCCIIRPHHGVNVAFRYFEYLELKRATCSFSRWKILGSGGFGVVYKGTLADGRKVAIKKLNASGDILDIAFVAEVQISLMKHDNILELYGFCIHESKRLLVYEYVPNKSLRYHLHGKPKRWHLFSDGVLGWEKRLKIAIGSADGLAYLHGTEYPGANMLGSRIIHRDIKPDNILISSDFEAKIGDFGTAKIFPNGRSRVTASAMVGTVGFLDPYYPMRVQEGIGERILLDIDEKVDVYAFGIVLLELITGHKAIMSPIQHITMFAEPKLIQYFTQHTPINNLNLVDKRLTNYNSDEMDRMLTCAAVCVQRRPEDRPQMSEVANALKGVAVTLDSFKATLVNCWSNDGGRQPRILDIPELESVELRNIRYTTM